MREKKEFLEEVNIGRGIAIIFVIVAHYITIIGKDFVSVYPASLYHGELFLYSFIFTCDMPFFMFIAGLILSHQGSKVDNLPSYLNFVKRKFSRVMIPYFTYSFLMVPLKYMLKDYAFRRPSSSFHDYLVSSIKIIFLYPLENPMIVLWFLYTLFIVFLLFPLVLWVSKRLGPAITLAVAICICFLPLPDIMNLKNMAAYMVYFYMGYLFASNRKCNVEILHSCRYLLLPSIVFLNIAYYIWFKGIQGSALELAARMVVIIISIFAMYEICATIAENKLPGYSQLNLVGKYSYDVYLNGHLTQIALRVLFINILPLDLITLSFILILGPIYIPIPIAYFIVRRHEITSRILLGIPANKAFHSSGR